MNLEHGKLPDNSEKNKTSQEHESFLHEQKVLRESKTLLEKLAAKIAQEFGIDVAEVKSMISGETLEGLEDLKKHISLPDNINSEKLTQAIQEAQTSIESVSQKYREELKSGLNPYPFTPDRFRYSSQKLFGETIMQRAKNPDGVFDELLGAGIGVVDSVEATAVYGGSVVMGVIKSPYHLYLLATGKAKNKNFKKL